MTEQQQGKLNRPRVRLFHSPRLHWLSTLVEEEVYGQKTLVSRQGSYNFISTLTDKESKPQTLLTVSVNVPDELYSTAELIPQFINTKLCSLKRQLIQYFNGVEIKPGAKVIISITNGVLTVEVAGGVAENEEWVGVYFTAYVKADSQGGILDVVVRIEDWKDLLASTDLLSKIKRGYGRAEGVGTGNRS